MAEMILPGTYIEVRAEKLIVPGPFAIGNLGIVGTASSGDVGTVYTPANIGDAREVFGAADAFSPTAKTLVRALELAFSSGAQRVFAVRVADAGDAGAYTDGLAALENQDVHIIVLAGQSTGLAAALRAHVENASTDLNKRERIGVIGSDPSAAVSDLVAPDQADGRLVFVGPGIKAIDSASGDEVTLPGTYAAAAVAGRIASLDPHVSPTNKTINVNGLETNFNGTQLEQLVTSRVLALESRAGAVRIVRGISSSTNTAWTQVTTRRIVDYARIGTRAAANPFIGMLNNARVRQALKGSINSLLADMVEREMLVSYKLDVTATRDEEIRGIARVTMVVRPTFSIDYIRVVMYLE
jgi:hypothetical protein